MPQSFPPLTGLFLAIFTCISPYISIPKEYQGLVDVTSWEQSKDAPLIGRGGVEIFSHKSPFHPRESISLFIT
jgi:hypothetical protein